MKKNLTNKLSHDILLKELIKMMTTNEGVKQEVMNEIKRRVKPGTPITQRMWKFIYQTVRAHAIVETVKWKQKYITIE